MEQQMVFVITVLWYIKMTDRITLTEDKIWYSHEHDELEIDFNVDLNITGEEFYKQLKQQILQDQKKAEKYDALGNLINQVNDLLIENKDLKDSIERDTLIIENLTKERNQLDNKLEKIFQWHDDFVNPATVWKRLEAMKKENKG